MFPKTVASAALALLLALGGCSRRPPPAPAQAPQPAAETDYVASPEALAVRPAAGGGVVIEGKAAPGALVRLGAPRGPAVTTRADAKGRWRFQLPASDEARIFGLSERVGARTLQAQGYLLIGPAGKAALLRAGAGSLRLDPAAGPRLGAVDFDREGAAVVSGDAPPGAWISLELDGRQAAQARTDPSGHFTVAITRLAPGPHGLQALGDRFSRAAEVEISPAEPLVAGPLRSQFTKGGLRVDWLTPGGGVQSTVLLD